MTSSDSVEASPASTPELSFWRIVRQALKGEHLDFTAVPLNRAVLLLAVPMVLEMIMESLFAIVDMFWVSRLGKEAVAVVGLTESVMTLVYAVAIGISIAATAIVARRIGEKDTERAAQAAGQIIVLGVLVASTLGAVLGYFADDILRLMGAAPEVIELGTTFSRIVFSSSVFVFLLFLINAIFRGAGDAVLAMRTLWFANALNIILGPLFIFGLGPFPEMGVTGAAVATNIGRACGVFYQVWHLVDMKSRVRVYARHMRPVLAELRSIMTTALSGMAQLLISTTSWIGLFMILALFGSSAIAGYTIAIRLVMFVLLPAWGLANAGATLVGQNLGAQKPERAEQAVAIATRFNVIFLSAVGVVFVAFSKPIAGIFTQDAEVLLQASRALWIVSLAFPLYAAGMCLGAAFNGAGDTWTPTKLNFVCFWLGQVPLAWILSEILRWGPAGVFASVPISFTVLALWSHVLFKKGKWKEQKI